MNPEQIQGLETQFLQHMLDVAQQTYAIIKGRSRNALDEDHELWFDLVSGLNLVGLKARRVVENVKLDPADWYVADFPVKYPQIPWSDWATIPFDITMCEFNPAPDGVWEIATQELPALIAELEAVINPAPPVLGTKHENVKKEAAPGVTE